MPKFSGLCLVVLIFLLAGCASPQPVPQDQTTGTAPDPILPTPTKTLPPTVTPTLPPTPTPSLTPSPTITFTPTPTMMTVDKGSPVVVPVLLYHHIDNNDKDIRYYVSPGDFRIQLETLKQLGYTSIPMSQFLNVLKNGGELPARPVVFTFDDGSEDEYLNAFPVMKELGMTGTLYIVANRLDIKDFLSTGEVKEMISNGWEVGSHSMTHIDLRQSKDLSVEIYDSGLRLSAALGIPIQTFAYPFGATDEFISRKTKSYGYDAAMGLGKSYTHTLASLYYIDRLEIRHSTTLDNFVDMLPWKTP